MSPRPENGGAQPIKVDVPRGKHVVLDDFELLVDDRCARGAGFREDVVPLFGCARHVVGEGFGKVLEAVVHGVGRNETGVAGVAFLLVSPVATHVGGFRNQVVGRVVRLLLIEDVRELVVQKVATK